MLSKEMQEKAKIYLTCLNSGEVGTGSVFDGVYFAKAVVQKVPSRETRINTGFSAHLNQGELFPLHGAGGFGGDVVDDAVYMLYLVCDAV